MKKFKTLKYILFLFLTTRFLLITIGLTTRIFIYPNYAEWRLERFSNNEILDIWGEWDTEWYLDIAKNGYSDKPNYELHKYSCCNQANIAFFPLYPILIRFLGKIIGNYFIGALLISNLALFISAIFLYKLVKLEDDEATALRSIKYLFLFPASFILSGVFSEPIFLSLLLICFYFTKKRRWHLVGIFGFFLAMTKQIGILIFPLLIYQYLKSQKFELKFKKDFLYLFFIPSGTLLYLAYTYTLTDNFWGYFNIAKEGWKANITNPIVSLVQLLTYNEVSFIIGLYTVTFLMSILVFGRILKSEYLITGLILLIAPLMSSYHIAISMPRFSTFIFPLYILFAKLWKDNRIDQVSTVLFLTFQLVFMMYWSVGLLII